jgi:outer membrane protein assembly complex protein YaeT
LALGLILASTALFAQARVTSVELQLPPGADASGLAPLVQVHTGQPLSKRIVRETVERLFATGRFSNIVVRALERPDGVAIRFDLTPVQKLVSLRVVGNHVLTTAQVTSVARLSEGSEYDPDRIPEIQRLIKGAYRLRGYLSAQLLPYASWASAKGVKLTLEVQEGPPTLVRRIVVGDPDRPVRSGQGERRLSTSRVLSALGLEEGDVLDQTTLDQGLDEVRALLRKERFYRARLGEPKTELSPDGAKLTIPLSPGPKFSYRFSGNRSFSDAVLTGVLHYRGDEPLDRSSEERMAERVASFYRYQGFLEVSVWPREILSPDGEQAILLFEVVEGFPVVVQPLVFEGNQAIPSEQLRRALVETLRAREPAPEGDVHPTDDPLQLEGRTGKRAATEDWAPLAGLAFVEDAYREAAEAMTRLYREQGFLSAKVALSRAQVDEKAHVVAVTVAVQEGPQTQVEAVVLRASPKEIQLPLVAGLEAGKPFRPSAVEEARTSLLRALGKHGYLFAKVDAQSSLSQGDRQVRVELVVDAGPQVRVGQVILSGFLRTREALVRAHLRVHSGEVLDPDALFDTQSDLLVLGIFRQVAVRLLNPEVAEPVKDVVVDVKERPRFSNEVTGGYYLVDGPRVGGAVSMPNLLGRGISLTFRGSVNYVGLSTLPLVSFESPGQLQGLQGFDFRTNASLHQAQIYDFLPAKVGGRLDIIAERIHRPAYLYQRFAAVAGLDWAARKWLNLSLQYQIEDDYVNVSAQVDQLLGTLQFTDIERLRFPQGNFALHSVGPSATLDFRDDPANPTRGVLISATGEVTKDLGVVPAGEHIFTFKTSGNFSFYVPLAPRTVLAVSLRGGGIVLFDGSITIPPKRFYLGGATTLRGFSQDGVIPEDARGQYHQQFANCRALIEPGGCTDAATALLAGNQLPSGGGTLFTLGKSELRFPVSHDFDLGVFFEAGNLWLDPSAFRFAHLRYVAGTGIRYETPIGPLALDLGFNLFPDVVLNEPAFQVQFSVGLF